MSCSQCEDNREHGGQTPPCEIRKGLKKIPGVNACWIPSLGPDEARVMRLRGMLVSLSGLVEGSVILMEYGATREDLELLAEVESVINEHYRNEGD